jgi:hypothetical protein
MSCIIWMKEIFHSNKYLGRYIITSPCAWVLLQGLEVNWSSVWYWAPEVWKPSRCFARGSKTETRLRISGWNKAFYLHLCSISSNLGNCHVHLFFHNLFSRFRVPLEYPGGLAGPTPEILVQKVGGRRTWALAFSSKFPGGDDTAAPATPRLESSSQTVFTEPLRHAP